MIRVASVGDIHYGPQRSKSFARAFSKLKDEADLLLLAGDLTRTGRIEESTALVEDLRLCRVPVVAVLGNHEYQSGLELKIVEQLVGAGVHVLEGGSIVLEVSGVRVGVAGIKGFGGGFAGACGSEFGEPEMKLFARHSREQGRLLHAALEEITQLDADFQVVLTHFSPIEQTLAGEKREIYPFLGSFHLAEPIDAFSVDLAIHGHAHRGVEQGITAGGVPVRNVAYPVIRSPYRVYSLEPRARPVFKKEEWAAAIPKNTTS